MIDKTFDEYKTLFDEHLLDFIPDIDQKSITLYDSMKYSLSAGGKRLRPVLLMAACEFCGGKAEEALPYACAMEYLHTYSLIHDDTPCMDEDDLRRGRPTNHRVYGEATAVLAGDGLLTAAFSYLAKAPYSADIRIRAVEILSECAGELGMVGGQVLDMSSEQRLCTEQEVLDIQSRKTGALIRAACMLGVLAGGGNEAQLAAAGNFADHLGLAFQIRDDMLDVIGTAEEMGKAVGTDAVKNTFVQLYGLETCDKLVHEHTNIAVECLDVFSDSKYMKFLADQLTGRKV